MIMGKTQIEWCDETVNPAVGCSKCSPGCENCYAEKAAARLAKNPNPKIAAKYAGVVGPDGRWNGQVNYETTLGRLPKAPKSIFLGSMTDLLHENVPALVLENLGCEMAQWPQHRFLMLTKRAERLADWTFETANLWVGVTVCNQQEADEKIPLLLATTAAHRFISVEPMLGPIDLRKYLYGSYECALSCGHRQPADELPEKRCLKCGFVGPDDYETWGNGDSEECPECHAYSKVEEICPNCGTYMVQEHPDTPYIDWVIVGGETGPDARPLHPDWVRSVRDQCAAAGVPFFFKGWGEYMPADLAWYAGLTLFTGKSGFDRSCRPWGDDGPVMFKLAKHHKKINSHLHRVFDGVEHNERPW